MNEQGRVPEPGVGAMDFMRGASFRRDVQPSPARRLMAAILEDAVRELIRPGGGWRGARARRRAEVSAWFASDDVEWPFSFVNVCETLDVPAGRFRALLRGDATVSSPRGEDPAPLTPSES